MHSEDLVLLITFCEMLGISEEKLEKLIQKKRIDVCNFSDHRFVVSNEKTRDLLKRKDNFSEFFLPFLPLFPDEFFSFPV